MYKSQLKSRQGGGLVAPTFKNKSDLHILRKLWHILIGGSGVTLYYLSNIDIKTFAIGPAAIFIIAIVAETLRLKIPAVNRLALKVMGPFMRESEKNSASGLPFYALGCFLSMILLPEKIAVLSILFLVFADPISSMVGQKWGRDKIYKNKSLQGFMACFITCYVLATAYGLVFSSGGLNLVVFALLGGLVGALSELWSGAIDDNLVMPISSGLGLWGINFFFPVF